MNQAESTFRSGFNCAQAVLTSFTDRFDADKETLFKISNGFGGGMGRKQEVCGAVTGAIMAISLVHGRGEIDSMEKQETTYRKVRELIDAFTKEFGTISCSELLSGCNLLTDEGQKMFREQGLKEKCCTYVKRANEIANAVMW
jgi:C_GCAxxG_C_C family probable redox protein